MQDIKQKILTALVAPTSQHSEGRSCTGTRLCHANFGATKSTGHMTDWPGGQQYPTNALLQLPLKLCFHNDFMYASVPTH
ncbi:hypothetical protein E2C01_003422 [Portunus trituberculatus]|uniref:Uncharacterized protein n=1 Tax=Portunus trituberculatus TaxID=210409 RepID=A0A5B7CPR2_PORTR|nr:hypothetical protein [Portunus trituberculatus]